MLTLSNLKNTHRPVKKRHRVGRGVGSKMGKTCGRGVKGDKARSGYKRRYGHEGGQLPLYRKLPCRGFTNGLFKSTVYAVNFETIEREYSQGETVNLETLREKRLIPFSGVGELKILSKGTLTKKVKIEAHQFSATARQTLDSQSIAYKVVGKAATA